VNDPAAKLLLKPVPEEVLLAEIESARARAGNSRPKAA
jgi:hypothetical protein